MKQASMLSIKRTDLGDVDHIRVTGVIDGYDTTLTLFETTIESRPVFCLSRVVIYSRTRRSKRSSMLGELNHPAFFRLFNRWLRIVGPELSRGCDEYQTVIRAVAAYLGPIEMMRALSPRRR